MWRETLYFLLVVDLLAMAVYYFMQNNESNEEEKKNIAERFNKIYLSVCRKERLIDTHLRKLPDGGGLSEEEKRLIDNFCFRLNRKLYRLHKKIIRWMTFSVFYERKRQKIVKQLNDLSMMEITLNEICDSVKKKPVLAE